MKLRAALLQPREGDAKSRFFESAVFADLGQTKVQTW